MSLEYLRLEDPQLVVAENVAFSKLFGDRYFSDAGGLEEKDHVFVRGSDLASRWKDKEYFSICELGFGCGINFFLTKKLWKETNSEGWMHYVAIENYPLTKDALTNFSNIFALDYKELLSNLPPRISGFHTREFTADRIRLSLIYKPVLSALKSLEGGMNSWFLDGFSPSLNSEMWSEEVIKEIKRLSINGSIIKTYSASSDLKRNLEKVGFKTELVEGYGRKKQNIKASYSSLEQRVVLKNKSVAVIGAGFGGAAIVRTLKARGFYVEVFDGADEIASGASGNPAGILMPHLSLSNDPFSEFFIPGFTFSEGIFSKTDKFLQNGVLRQTTSDRLTNLFLALEEKLEDFAEQHENGNLNPTLGIYFKAGGTVALRSLTNEWINLADKVNLFYEVTDLNELKERFEYVVLATSYGIQQLTQIPVEPVRGQILIVEPLKLSLPICYEGYALPEIEGISVIGATYDHNNNDYEYSYPQQEQLIERFKKAAPKLELTQLVGGRVSFRTMTRDRLPIIGPYFNEDEFRLNYTNKNLFKFPFSSLDKKVFIASGFGSKGLLAAPISAELIANLICNEVRVLPSNIINQIAPYRFLMKELRKV